MTVSFLLRMIFYILSSGILLYTLWICTISVIGGMAPKKTYAPSAPQNIAVMICARNEEKVIGHLIDSLNQQDYPKENYKIFVVAHNCQDRTAETAAAHGASVFVRNSPEENKKAQALQYGLSQVREAYGDFFSHYAVFDADCLVHRDFLKEINAGLASGADAASGYYSSKNFEDSLVSRLAGTLYYALMEFSCIPQNNLGMPLNVYGSGYAAKMSLGVDLDQLDTMVDDFEFSTRLVMQDAKLIEVPTAIIYAEMPVTLCEALMQRRRWSMGNTQCYRKYRKQLRRKLPRLGWNGIKQYMDLCMNPVATITTAGLLLGLVLLLTEGSLSASAGYILTAVIVFCGFFFCSAVITLKRKEKGIRENLSVCLLFPLWILLSAVYAVDTMFRKDVEWVQTKRVSLRSVEDMEELKKNEKVNIQHINSEK